MSFKIHLMSAADAGLSQWPSATERSRLTLHSGDYDLKVDLPRPGHTIVRAYDLADINRQLPGGRRLDLTRAGRLNFDATVASPVGTVGFGYRGIGADDVLSIIQLDQDKFLANVRHVHAGVGCRAVCADGTEGQPCVDCVVNGLTIRICC
jgi:hypothetical protein